MQYLTYEEYSNIGGTLEETAFNRYIDRACGVINNATHNRIKSMSEIPSMGKALCRDLVEYMATNSSVTEKSVSSWSESTGPVSESVSYVQKSKEDMQSDIDELIYQYLGSVSDDNGTPLLYRGCSV